MPLFQYVAFSEEGKKETGQVEGVDEKSAFERLSQLGLTVVNLTLDDGQSGTTPWYLKQLNFGGDTLPLAVQADVAEQMSIMFRAGLSVPQVISVIETGTVNKKVRTHFTRARKLVAEGLSFSDAFEKSSSHFAPVFVSLLRSADQSANFVDPLETLGRHMRRYQTIRAELRGALVYPIILILAAFLLFLFVVFYLAPNIAPLFSSVDQPIPGTLSTLISIGDFLRGYYWLIIPGIIALPIVYLAMIQLPALSKKMRQVALKLPIIGPIAKTSALTQLTRSLELLLRAGRPLPTALKDAASFAGGAIYAEDFRLAAERLETGARASDAFPQNPNVPVMFHELFRVGEETNTLEAVMPTLGDTFENQLERQIKSAQRLITPVLTLILGGAVGFLVISIMSAILSVNELAF